MDELVSIAMPAFNAADTIELAIQSVVAQTYPNWELVIVDDASTDSTADTVRSFADSRIRLFSNSTNQGEGITRDNAISNCEGFWLAFLDADDAWDPRRLEMLLSLDPAASGNFLLIDNIMCCIDKGVGLIPWRPIRSEQNMLHKKEEGELVDYLTQNSYLMKPVFPMSALTEFSICHSKIRYGADAEFFIRLLHKSKLKIKATAECLYYYRMTPGAMSSRGGARESMKKMLLSISDELALTDEESGAIREKIKAQDRHLEYAPFAEAIREGKYVLALKLCLLKPRRLMLFLWRLPSELSYRCAVRRVGGKARSLH